MNKDTSKILSTTLITYVFILFFIFILKLVGLDYFGIDINNPIIIKISNIINSYKIDYIIDICLLYFYTYIIISISLNAKDKKIKIYSLILTIIGIINQILLSKSDLVNFKTPIELIIWVLFFIIIGKKDKIKRFMVVLIANILFQYISVLTRSNNNILYLNNTIIELILNLDYILLMIISYKLCFIKGGKVICGQAVGSYLQKLTLSIKQLKKYLTKFLNKSKKDKFEIILFTILCLIWNIFTLLVIILIAKINDTINDTIIECIFILSSFWISKSIFGKAFHLNNALHCFILSNICYYCLNRITTPIGISILIPIILGILLSYFTSKLVKENKTKKLYRGMTKELFDELILKVTNKDDIDYKICYLYYIEKQKEEKISYMVNYSKEAVQKHKKKINDKIKEL